MSKATKSAQWLQNLSTQFTEYGGELTEVPLHIDYSKNPDYKALVRDLKNGRYDEDPTYASDEVANIVRNHKS